MISKPNANASRLGSSWKQEFPSSPTNTLQKLLIASHENFTYLSRFLLSRETSHRCGFEDYNSRPSVLILFVAGAQRCPPVKTSIRGGLEVRKLDLKAGNEDSQRLAACPSSLIRPPARLWGVHASSNQSSALLQSFSPSLQLENFSLAGEKGEYARMIGYLKKRSILPLSSFLGPRCGRVKSGLVWGSEQWSDASGFCDIDRFFARSFDKVGSREMLKFMKRIFLPLDTCCRFIIRGLC